MWRAILRSAPRAGKRSLSQLSDAELRTLLASLPTILDRARDGIPPLSHMPGGSEPGGTIDLHVHSTASDGSLAPEAVVKRARAAGLTAIALTDHDTLGGIPEALAAGERFGVRVIGGCEFSAAAPWGEMHVLGYFLPSEFGRAERIPGAAAGPTGYAGPRRWSSSCSAWE